MNRYRQLVCPLAALVLLAGASSALADAKSKAATEAAEYALARFGRQAVKGGVPALAARIESAAARHGDDVIRAVRRVGQSAVTLVEEAGQHGARAASVMARHGEPGVSLVLKNPKGLAQFLRHGEPAAAALVKHPGVAGGLIEKAGLPAAKALEAVGQRSGRRMAMALENELAGLGASRSAELLEVVARHGERAAAFVWDNKGALAVASVMAAFLADPEPFINGTRDVGVVAAEHVPKAAAAVAAPAAAELGKGVARGALGTVSGGTPVRLALWGALVVALLGVPSAAAVGFWAWRSWLSTRAASGPQAEGGTPPATEKPSRRQEA